MILNLQERNWLSNPISKRELLNITIAERLAIEDLKQQDAAAWVVLRDAAAVCETMALGGVGPEAQPVASAALALLQALHLNQRVPTPAEVKTLSEMLAYHDEQRRIISRSEVLVWVKKTVEKFNVR